MEKKFYEQKVQDVRELPQETTEQKVEKKERARLLRMELIIDNALCTDLFLKMLEENPELDVEILKQTLKRMLTIKESNIDFFVHHLAVTRKNIDDIYQNELLPYVESIAASDEIHKSLGDIFFQWSLPKDRNFIAPIGRVDIEVEYPFAFVMHVENPDDFEIIDNRTNIGGFYTEYTLQDPTTKRSFRYPVIVINGPPKSEENVLLHEKGHAEHKIFKSTTESVRTSDLGKHWNLSLADQVREAPHKFVWGQFGMYPDAVARILDDESKIVRSKSELVSEKRTQAEAEEFRTLKKGQARKQILQSACEQAKDELLAQFNATKDLSYLTDLLKKGGLYDYFKDMGIPINSEIYDDLWDEYDQIMFAATNTAQEVLYAYNLFGLGKRVEIFHWILAQIPAENWKGDLKNNLFLEEADILGKINQLIIDSPDFRADNKQSDFMQLVDRFDSDLFKQQERIILPMLRQYLIEFENLKS